MDTNPSLQSREKESPVLCCCRLAYPWRALFWGGALVLIGGSWLLQDLGLVQADWGSFLFPFLLVIYGLVLLVGVARWWR